MRPYRYELRRRRRITRRISDQSGSAQADPLLRKDLFPVVKIEYDKKDCCPFLQKDVV